MSDHHWYNRWGRDKSDQSQPPVATTSAHAPTLAPTGTAAPSQERAPSDEDEEFRPALIKGRSTWRKTPKAQQKLVKQYYKRYELDWPNLLAWLKNNFQGVEFAEELDATKDNFVFYTPRELTETERDGIKKLRNDYRGNDT